MIEPYLVEGVVRVGARVIPPGQLVVDTAQTDSYPPDVKRLRLKTGDWLLYNGETLLLVEEKRLSDLKRSWKARRLQRQLRWMLQANPSGLNILGLRGSGPSTLQETFWDYLPQELALDLLKWQALGGLVGYLPHSPRFLPKVIREWSASLKPGVPLLSILAGRDLDKRPKASSPFEQALMRLFDGVGRVTAEKIAARVPSLAAMLNISDEELRAAKIPAKVIEQIRRL